MVAAIGALLVRFKSVGFANVIGKTGKFQSKFGGMAKEVGPQLKKLTSGFKRFGLVSSGVMFSLTKASPRLAAEFEILAIRTEQLIRPFGDELAPLLRIVSNLINDLRKWFEALPEPLQNAITFGISFAVVIGVIVGALSGLIMIMSPVALLFAQLIVAGAALHLAWETNFLNIRQLVESVFSGIRVAIDGIIGYFAGVIDFIQNLGQSIIGVFQGVLDFIKAVFAGDLTGALDAIKDIFENAIKSILIYITWPLNALNEMIKGILGSDFLGKMTEAGTAFIGAFFEGIEKAIDGGLKVIEEILGWLAEFFGGSLPERGPLMNIATMGEELGQAYVVSVGSGIGSTSNDLSRTLSIENLNMGFREEQLDTERSFFDGMTEGVRKSTSW